MATPGVPAPSVAAPSVATSSVVTSSVVTSSVATPDVPTPCVPKQACRRQVDGWNRRRSQARCGRLPGLAICRWSRVAVVRGGILIPAMAD